MSPTTQIKYDLPENTLVNITIYDLTVIDIKSLVNFIDPHELSPNKNNSNIKKLRVPEPS